VEKNKNTKTKDPPFFPKIKKNNLYIQQKQKQTKQENFFGIFT